MREEIDEKVDWWESWFMRKLIDEKDENILHFWRSSIIKCHQALSSVLSKALFLELNLLMYLDLNLLNFSWFEIIFFNFLVNYHQDIDMTFKIK